MRYSVDYEIANGPAFDVRRDVVEIIEGVNTFEDIRKILAISNGLGRENFFYIQIQHLSAV